jgi:hypothetical protein
MRKLSIIPKYTFVPAVTWLMSIPGKSIVLSIIIFKVHGVKKGERESIRRNPQRVFFKR